MFFEIEFAIRVGSVENCADVGAIGIVGASELRMADPAASWRTPISGPDNRNPQRRAPKRNQLEGNT